jgi:hypothetical protein
MKSGLLKKVRNEGSRRNEWQMPKLPGELRKVSDTISGSHQIVNRNPEPDEEFVLTVSESTWRRAVDLLVAHASQVWDFAGIAIKPPVISAGRDGSVDLYWHVEPYGLLVNVPATADQPPTYYGDDRSSPETNKTSGEVKPNRPTDPGILMWLAHLTT